MTDGPGQSRKVSDRVNDDAVLPFAVEPLDVRGKIVRLGPMLDGILGGHHYPPEVARLTGEAAALTTLLGTALKYEGRFQLQTRTDGVVNMLVVDFDAPDRLRAMARFDETALEQARVSGNIKSADLLGSGHLALTVDRGSASSRYQGVVALDGQGLEVAADQYFRQSEQIPTLVRLAVGEIMDNRQDDARWRAGGLMVQFLPSSSERGRQPDIPPGNVPEGVELPEQRPEDDAWTEAKALAGSVEDHELVDPDLSAERLLYRLFHERGVKVFDPVPVQNVCRCTREGILTMLRRFTREEREAMVGDDGLIGVTCEFCNTHRTFEPSALDITNGN